MEVDLKQEYIWAVLDRCVKIDIWVCFFKAKFYLNDN